MKLKVISEPPLPVEQELHFSLRQNTDNTITVLVRVVNSGTTGQVLYGFLDIKSNGSITLQNGLPSCIVTNGDGTKVKINNP